MFSHQGTETHQNCDRFTQQPLSLSYVAMADFSSSKHKARLAFILSHFSPLVEGKVVLVTTIS